MGRANVMESPIRTPEFILKVKGGIHTFMDEKSQKAKNHVSNQQSVYKSKLATKEKEIRLKYKGLIDPIKVSKSALEIRLEEEKSSRNPEIKAHAAITEKKIRDLEGSISSLEEEMNMVVERSKEQYNRKISAYLHHTHLRREG